MALREIALIPMPDRDRFFAQYVYTRQPVVVTNLFAGQAIANIGTIEDAARAWGDVKIHLQEEYTGAEGAVAPAQPIYRTVREYIDLVRSDPSTRLCCT